MDHEQGRKRRREPRGAWRRDSWIYGCNRARAVGFAGEGDGAEELVEEVRQRHGGISRDGGL